ncbi:kinase-like protein [Rozella allomycis CSF55]|uniref:Kinase-like protein n=1 Tax=Rozella allomycis (strain CSF55) TaxID=988480 RepID=A0A4P9YE84_ROZAC|nr:kinase-like protein [Rozella allomycis CSF55]
MPRILAAFDFGRVEEYIQGVAPLTPSNMRKPGISKKIAKQLRILHCVEVKEKSTQIWSQLDKWYTLLLSNQNLEQNHIEIIDNKLKELKMKLENSYEDEQTCLIHGDLQYGNILCDEDENLMLIDFEYSLIAQREYDIANHFCEWMANYDSENPHILHQNLFPSLEERYNFYRAYFEEKENVQLEQFDLIVMSFVPLSHLFWCIWVARILRFHRKGRGSIPRCGNLFHLFIIFILRPRYNHDISDFCCANLDVSYVFVDFSSFSFASWALLVIVVFQGVYPFDCDTTVRIANFLESMGMMGIDYLLLYRAILLSFKNKYVMWFSYFTVAVRGIVGVMNLVFPGAKMMDGVCMYGWDVDVLTTFVVIDMLVDIIVTTVTIQSLRQYLNDAKQYLSNVGAPIQVAVIKSSVIRSFMILIVNIVMILAIFHRLLSQHGLTKEDWWKH